MIIALTFLTCLKNRKAASKRHRSMKRKDLGREPSLSRSAFQRPWQCGRENKTNLYVGFEFGTWIAGVPCHPTQWKTASVMNSQPPQKKSVVWKGKHEGERLLSREQLPTWTALQLKQSHLRPGKLGDNLFMLCCLSNLISLTHLDSLISKTWSAGLLSFRFIISVGRRTQNIAHLSPQLHLSLKCHLLSILLTQTPVIGAGARRHTTRERVRIRHLSVHVRAFSVHITNLQQTCCCSLPARRCLAAVSSAGVRLESVEINRQNTSRLRCNSRGEIPALRFQGVPYLLLSIQGTFCYMSGMCNCSSYHHLLRLNYLFAV